MYYSVHLLSPFSSLWAFGNPLLLVQGPAKHIILYPDYLFFNCDYGIVIYSQDFYQLHILK